MIVLQEAGVRADVDPSDGGRLVALTLRGHQILAACDGAPTSFFHGCFPLAPWCGVAAASPGGIPEELDGAQHGLVHAEPWDVVDAGASWAVLSLCLGPAAPPASAPSTWPWRGRAELRYRVRPGGIGVTLTVHPIEAMPAAVGLHPWFVDRLGADAVRVDIAPTARLAPSPHGRRRRRTGDLGARPWDDLFTGVAQPVRLRWGTALTLTLRSEAPVWVVYERTAGGVCVEPWSAPDGPLDPPGATTPQIAVHLDISADDAAPDTPPVRVPPRDPPQPPGSEEGI